MEVPAGQHLPYATITPHDHSAWIIIAAALGLSLILLFAAIRVFIRSAISSGYGLDDYLLATATVVATIQSSVVLKACADGLGKSRELLQQTELEKVQKQYYATNLLFVVPLVFSKASISVFLLRLTPVRSHRRTMLGLLGFLTTWGVAFFFAIAFSCNPSHPWVIVDRKCTTWYPPWEVMEILGCIFEAALFAVSCWLVWELKTSRGNKAVVVVAFSFRLLMIVIVGFRLGSFNRAGLASDPTLLEAQFIAWTSTELNYSIISATIPILRPFVTNLSTHYGGGQGSSGNGYGGYSAGSYGLQLGSTTGGHSIRMKTFNKRARESQLPAVSNSASYCYGAAIQSRAVDSGLGAREATGDKGEAASVSSNGSQKMIIRKDVTWQVDHNGQDGGLEDR